jgi:hypothetical protein
MPALQACAGMFCFARIKNPRSAENISALNCVLRLPDSICLGQIAADPADPADSATTDENKRIPKVAGR